MRDLKGGRLALFVAAILLACACALTIAVTHAVIALPQMLMLAGVALLIAFERRRYGARAPSALARATGERFRDPASGRLTEVYYDEKTGARSYRPIG